MSRLRTAVDRAEAVKQADLFHKATDRDLLEEIGRRGFMAIKQSPDERRIQISAKTEGRARFGVVSDTHLGSRYQQLTHWRDFTIKAADWGAEFMLHCGDVVDGSGMRRGHELEVFQHGAHAQGTYAAEVFPKLMRGKKTLPTHIIGGNHDEDFWKNAGANVIDTIVQRRPDLQFHGAPAATFYVGPIQIYLLHPDGGAAYARSYKLQKIVEQFAPDNKPHIMLAGHWHVPCYVPGYRNVEAFSLPCFQSQTPFLKRKGLAPVVGGFLFEIEWSKKGLEDMSFKRVIYPTHLRNDYP